MNRKKILKSRLIIAEMMVDRGIEVEWPDVDLEEMAGVTDKDFLTEIGALSTDGRVSITWVAALSAETVRTVASEFAPAGEEGVVHAIVVVGSETAPGIAKVGVYNKVNPQHKIEVWNWSACQFNPTKHELVCRHSRTPQEEVDEVCRIHHVTLDEFPRLQPTDAQCRWYDFPIGSVVTIERPEGKSYRVVRP